jgi:hypothetical protein
MHKLKPVTPGFRSNEVIRKHLPLLNRLFVYLIALSSRTDWPVFKYMFTHHVAITRITGASSCNLSASRAVMIVTLDGRLCKADRSIKGERWAALHASARPDNCSLELDIMADIPSSEKSFLIREAEFVAHGLALMFYGILALLATGEFSYVSDIGIYTTLIGFLIYYFFGISFILSLTQSLTASQH